MINPLLDAAPRERLITLPQAWPERSLGLTVAAWMIDNLRQPNGPNAGQPFTPTPGQIDFLQHFYALNEHGEWLYNHAVRRLAKGSGKAVGLDEAVPTPQGFKRFGDLKVGDRIYAPDGSTTRVIQLHPIEEGRNCLLVCYNDGFSQIFSEEHLFTVRTERGLETLPVAELKRRLDAGERDSFQLPMRSPLPGVPREVAFYADGAHDGDEVPEWVDLDELRRAGVNVTRKGRIVAGPHAITAIEDFPTGRTRCITVDREDGLFLVGRNYAVTHNSPWAAAVAIAEMWGPVRFDRWAPESPFGVEGKPMSMPLVQVVAVSEDQTKNTMRMVRQFAKKGSILQTRYGVETAKTFLEDANGGRLEQRASSAASLEGGEVSFVVADELEHWVPGNGGLDLIDTLEQNAAKSGSRTMHTCNAWVPGEDSAAEKTFEDWVLQQEGETRGKQQILYDAIVAPPNAVLTDEPEEGQVGLQEALEFVYKDCPWVNIPAIKEQIWSPRYSESRSMRFFLNRPNAAENSWVPLEEWTLLRDPSRVVEDGEEIVMFFDGSKSNDHTALVGCCMSDGHIFKLGHWAPEKTTKEVNVAAVDAGVRRAFEKYDVVAFWADVREWESFVRTTWPEDYGDRLVLHAVKGEKLSASPIAWDMRSHAYQFAEAAETAFNEIQEKEFTHDGDHDLGEHVSNCRVHEFRGRFSVKKESPKSPKKIDLAVCMIGARMVYRAVKNSKEWRDRNKPKGGWVLSL